MLTYKKILKNDKWGKTNVITYHSLYTSFFSIFELSSVKFCLGLGQKKKEIIKDDYTHNGTENIFEWDGLLTSKI